MFFGLSLLALCLLMTQCDRGAQKLKGGASALSVEIFTPEAGEIFQGPTNIQLIAWAKITGARAGDKVKVDFYANTNFLGSAEARWHEAVFPPKDPHHFHYMHVLPAGFDALETVWRKPASGNYALTLKASGPNGLAATSAPVNVTVLPAGAPR
jgi:hypothetical protein